MPLDYEALVASHASRSGPRTGQSMEVTSLDVAYTTHQISQAAQRQGIEAHCLHASDFLPVHHFVDRTAIHTAAEGPLPRCISFSRSPLLRRVSRTHCVIGPKRVVGPPLICRHAGMPHLYFHCQKRRLTCALLPKRLDVMKMGC